MDAVRRDWSLDPAEFFSLLHQAEGTCAVLANADKKPIGGVPAGAAWPRAVLDMAFQGDEVEVFLTVNGMAIRSGKNSLGLLHARRRSEDARALNACWVDLDVGRYLVCQNAEGFTDYEALLSTVDAREARQDIPQASLVVRSGTGLWLLWLLHDDETARPPQVTPAHLALFRRLQGELSGRLDELRPDRRGQDAARLMRVPGTTNLKRPGLPKVAYLVRRTPQGHPVRYALDTLAATLGVSQDAVLPVGCLVRTTSPRVLPPVDPPLRRSPPNPQAPPESLTALVRRILRPSRSRFGSRVDGLLHLERMRDGFAQGHRNTAAWFLGYFGRLALHSVERQEGLIRAVAGRCRPPLAESEALSSLAAGRAAAEEARASREHRYVADATVIERLDVSDEERSAVKWRATPTVRRPPGARREQTAQRRQVIARLVAQSRAASPPSTRTMTSWLARAGIKASKSTVATDYKTLKWAASSQSVVKPPA